MNSHSDKYVIYRIMSGDILYKYVSEPKSPGLHRPRNIKTQRDTSKSDNLTKSLVKNIFVLVLNTFVISLCIVIAIFKLYVKILVP